LVSEFGWLNCFAIADSSRLPKGAGYDTRSVLADQSRDVGASCGWRGVNPIRDQVRPSSSLMLIRWQTYRSKGGLYRGKTTRIRAILSESVRVNGQSRQKFIAVIGSVVTERLDVEARRDFWKAAHECLSTHVPDDDRSRIEAALARRVPPLTAAEEAPSTNSVRCLIGRLV
jgi:hypothetical protein